jgi:cytochrome P450
MPAVAQGNADNPDLRAILTPPSGGSLLFSPTLTGIAAWIGVRVLCKPLRIGKYVIAARYRDVDEVLRRDLDFRIAPVNAAKMEAVNGPFILGMDRGDTHTTERHALYAAMSAVDIGAVIQQAQEDADRLLTAASVGSVDAVAGYARLVAGRTAMRLFGVTGPDEPTFLEVARAIFGHTFLNITDDKDVEARALKAAELMRAWLATEIQRRRDAGVTGTDLMGTLMRQPALDDDGVRRNLGGMLVGAVDTTATCVAKILVMFGRDRELYEAARRDAHDLKLTLGWCREALRRWPHNPILQRAVTADTLLNGVAIPAGSQVFIWTQAAMLDASAFPDPGQMKPDRPGAAYFHFGGGLHPCAGRLVNDRQIPMLIAKLLERGIEKVGKVSWAGPFPNKLPIQLRSP